MFICPILPDCCFFVGWAAGGGYSVSAKYDKEYLTQIKTWSYKRKSVLGEVKAVW